MKDDIMKLIAESYDKGVADALRTMQDSAQDIIDAAVDAEREVWLKVLQDCVATIQKRGET